MLTHLEKSTGKSRVTRQKILAVNQLSVDRLFIVLLKKRRVDSGRPICLACRGRLETNCVLGWLFAPFFSKGNLASKGRLRNLRSPGSGQLTQRDQRTRRPLFFQVVKFRQTVPASRDGRISAHEFKNSCAEAEILLPGFCLQVALFCYFFSDKLK